MAILDEIKSGKYGHFIKCNDCGALVEKTLIKDIKNSQVCVYCSESNYVKKRVNKKYQYVEI